ncbi:MAG: CHAT domain-containing protein [Micromonosporaceae bacterium]|nr:CHAT domain-containing protein [Micromonosporaceae bacterium]
MLLQATNVVGAHRWRWLLVDEDTGAPLADHDVTLDRENESVEAFEDLYRFVQSRADPARRVASETELVGSVGSWIGSHALGEQIGHEIVNAAPVTVRIQLPKKAEFLAFRPWELAHVDGRSLAARGNISLVFDFSSDSTRAKAPIDERLRMLAVFSLPAGVSTLGLRRERYELTRLVRRTAARSRRVVEVEVAQYGVTRDRLRDLAASGRGWDVLHLSGHGSAGQFLLERSDGSMDSVTAGELVELLGPLRRRVKLAVISACQSAATVAETLRWLDLGELSAETEGHADAETQLFRDGRGAANLARTVISELGCAVVAMRYPVTDEFAISLADRLYDGLFRHGQSLDAALPSAVRGAAGACPSAGRPALSIGTPAVFGGTAIGLSLTPPAGKPMLDPTAAVMTGFPSEPDLFVGRSATMVAASRALAAESGRTAVVLHGPAGVGKTTCVLELAYRHARTFEAAVFWRAPQDPGQFGTALASLSDRLEAPWSRFGFAMANQIRTKRDFDRFLPQLTTLLRETGLLLVLDNLESLLTADGTWRDPRWAALMRALTVHDGESRVLITSRVLPADCDRRRMTAVAVPALSRDESLLLAKELPNLRRLLHADADTPCEPGAIAEDRAIARRALRLAQGYPQLLMLANGAAGDPAQLADRVSATESAAGVEEPRLEEFLRLGRTVLDDEQLVELTSAWTHSATEALAREPRVMLQAFCRREEEDREAVIAEDNWGQLWRRLGYSEDPPAVADALAPLIAADLVRAEPVNSVDLDDTVGLCDPAESPDANRAGTTVRLSINPGVAQAVHAGTPPEVAAVMEMLAEQQRRATVPPGQRWRRRGFIVVALGLAILVVAASALVSLWIVRSGNRGVSNVITAPIEASGSDPFMPPVGTDQPGVQPPTSSGGVVPGSRSGFFGGTLGKSTCDPDQMVAVLKTRPALMAVWTEILGIRPEDLDSYAATLTPAVLRTDTLVMNHGFRQGRATSFRAVLQAGTAVLLDRFGFPAVKCYCGNPLTRGEPVAEVRFQGPAWPGFSASRIVDIQPVSSPLTVVIIMDLSTGRPFQRPVGSRGDDDRPYRAVDTDWRNTRYSTNCWDRSEQERTVEVHGGRYSARVGDSTYDLQVDPVVEDLTGDGVPEASVLLTCTHQPSNYFLNEIQVFGDGPRRLQVLPTPPDRPEPQSLGPYFEDPFVVRDAQLITGAAYYVDGDTHASGPSLHAVVSWRWNGHEFVSHIDQTTRTPAEPSLEPSPAAPSPTPPPVSSRTTTVVVDATAPWVDTGIDVQRGNGLKITATGAWSDGTGPWSPDGRPEPWGDSFLNLTDLGVCPTCAETKVGHYDALVGYVGAKPPQRGSYTSTGVQSEARKVFVVGQHYSTSAASRTGRLWLIMNSDAYSSYTTDNSGHVTATITASTG